MMNLDELSLKFVVYKYVIGQATETPPHIPTEHECRLGGWYDENKHKQDYHPSILRTIERPHQAVHDEARFAVNAYHRGDLDATVRHLEHMEVANLEVMKTISDVLSSL